MFKKLKNKTQDCIKHIKTWFIFNRCILKVFSMISIHNTENTCNSFKVAYNGCLIRRFKIFFFLL